MKNFAFSLFISLSVAFNSFAGVAPAKSAFSPVEDREAVSSASQLRAFAKAAEVELAGLPNHTSLDEVTARVQQLALDYDVKLTSDLETNIEILRDAGLIDQVQEQQVRNLSEYLEQNGEKDITLADLKSQSLEGTQVAALNQIMMGFGLFLLIYSIITFVKSANESVKEYKADKDSCKAFRDLELIYSKTAEQSIGRDKEDDLDIAKHYRNLYLKYGCDETIGRQLIPMP